MGDEELGAAFGFFIGLGLVYGLGRDGDTVGVFGFFVGLGEDRDTAGAGAGGEVARVVVEPKIQPLFSGFL